MKQVIIRVKDVDEKTRFKLHVYSMGDYLEYGPEELPKHEYCGGSIEVTCGYDFRDYITFSQLHDEVENGEHSTIEEAIKAFLTNWQLQYYVEQRIK